MIFRSKSRRLGGYDYRSPGAYFITIKTYGNRVLFGNIHEGITFPNAYGRIVLNEWRRISNVRENVRAAECILMPDHFHGILDILPYRRIDSIQPEFTLRSGSIGAIIGQFKSRVTKHIRHQSGNPHLVVWQTNYHDHIIRSAAERERIRRYIHDNPKYFHP